MPLIAAFIKRTFFKNPSTVFAGHVIYNKDGSEVTEHQFNEIKNTILRPNEFPTALKNSNYNPDADETKVIQEKLDGKYKHKKYSLFHIDPFNEYTLTEPNRVIVKWIPQTVHDLFSYREYDEYKVNQEIHHHLLQNPKNNSESNTAYYQRIAEPLIGPIYNEILDIQETPYNYEALEHMKQAVQSVIDIETSQHKQDQSKVLLYRGQGAGNDFFSGDCYDVGKQGHNAIYCKQMAKNSYDGIPTTLSYGLSLLSGSRRDLGACPFAYAFKDRNDNNDLQLLPVLKKEFINPKGLWYVNPDYDYHKSVHAKGVYFHPRAKGHTTKHIIKTKAGFHNDYFKRQDSRFILHPTKYEAFNGYKQLKEYQIHNAIGVTEYTKEMINKARESYNQGKREKN